MGVLVSLGCSLVSPLFLAILPIAGKQLVLVRKPRVQDMEASLYWWLEGSDLGRYPKGGGWLRPGQLVGALVRPWPRQQLLPETLTLAPSGATVCTPVWSVGD